MKKCKTIFALLIIILIPFGTIIADEVADTDLNVQISNSEANKIIVSIPNDEQYDNLKPEISIDTPFSNAKVELNGVEVASTINNGIVTFTIENHNCSYIITNIETTNTKAYQFPKTGIN